MSGWLAANHADEYSRLAALPHEAVESISMPRQYDSSNQGLTKANTSHAATCPTSDSNDQWLANPCKESKPARTARTDQKAEPVARANLLVDGRGDRRSRKPMTSQKPSMVGTPAQTPR